MKKFLMFCAGITLALGVGISNYSIKQAKATYDYSLEDYDAISNLDFYETTFHPSNVTKVTKGQDRYGVYFDISMRMTAQWGMGICQFPLPMDVTNTTFYYEILEPQTTYWVMVGVASRQINQEVPTQGAYWDMSQEFDVSMDEGTTANRGILGMYMNKATLDWQKGMFYKAGNGTTVPNATFTYNKEEKVEIKLGTDDELITKISDYEVPVEAKRTNFEDDLCYIQFEACSSDVNQVSKIRLRLNKVDLGEDFVPIDLTEYNTEDVSAEDFDESIDNRYVDYSVKKGSDEIGDYFDINAKFKNGYCTTTIQFPIPLDVFDSEGKGLSFSYRFLNSALPFWFGVGVTGDDIQSFRDFTGSNGSPSAFGLYFQDQLAQYQLLWNKENKGFNTLDLEDGKIPTGIPYTKDNYVHVQMVKNNGALNVKVNNVLMENTCDYYSCFPFNKGYITFMACSMNAGESVYFRLRVGTNGTENYTNEEQPEDVVKHVESISVKVDNKEVDSIKIVKGKSKTLVVTVYPADAEYSAITYTVENEDIASISSSGRITAKEVGSTKVKIKVEDIEKIINVEVEQSSESSEGENEEKENKKLTKKAVIGIVCGAAAALLIGGAVAIIFISKKK